MRLFFCSLNYLDDTALLDLHRSYHAIEKLYLSSKKSGRYKYYLDFIFRYPQRMNWFIQLHKRILSELKFRYSKPGKQYIHNTPSKLPEKLKYFTWIPPQSFIENDIEYLKHRWRFKNKTLTYTKRPIPHFLKDVKRDILMTCDTCDKNTDKCPFKKNREKYNYCDYWTDKNTGLSFFKYSDSIQLLHQKTL